MHGPPFFCGWLALGLLVVPLDLVGAADLVGPAASIHRAGFSAAFTPRLRGGQEIVRSILVADGGSMEHLPPGTKPPRFVPSYEWQRVLPGQAVPPGLWIKMDISSGATYAKLMGGPQVPDPTIAAKKQSDLEKLLGEFTSRVEGACEWLVQLLRNNKAEQAPRAASFRLQH